jgi:hypothetical protein
MATESVSDETEKLVDNIFLTVKAYAASTISKKVDPLEVKVRDLSEKVDTLSRENAVLAHRLAVLEAKAN